MFIGPTHQPMNIIGLAYVAAVAPYVRRVRRVADEHKLHMSVEKPTNVIWNINVGPNEYKKNWQTNAFFCSVMITRVTIQLAKEGVISQPF
jgi:hypothetical protein